MTITEIFIPKKIAQKVWLSMSILIIAYCLNNAQNFISKGNIQTQLNEIGKSSEISANASHDLISSLEIQMKNYEAAVMTGEKESLEKAEASMEDSIAAISRLAMMPYISAETLKKLDTLKSDITMLTRDAKPVYLTLIDRNETEETPEKLRELSDRKMQCLTQAGHITQMAGKELNAALNAMGRSVDQQKWQDLLTFIISLSVSLLLVTVVVNRYISRPIKRIVENFKDIAQGEGDLTQRLDITTNDEIADLAKWFNTFAGKLQGIVKDIATTADTLNSSSGCLYELSEKMSGDATEMSTTSKSVALSSKEMSSNMNVISSSTEEMASGINEISKNTGRADRITSEAVVKAKDTSSIMEQLRAAAQEIGNVTETITKISEQTNLLALNATIEAARAGASGKGFAVVANEIKELARQTAGATGEIKDKIEAIQNSTQTTIHQIGEISTVITEVNDIVSVTAASMEEQSVTTREIAVSVEESNNVSGQISTEIMNINQKADEFSESSSQIKMDTKELSGLSENLKKLVNQFKV